MRHWVSRHICDVAWHIVATRPRHLFPLWHSFALRRPYRIAVRLNDRVGRVVLARTRSPPFTLCNIRSFTWTEPSPVKSTRRLFTSSYSTIRAGTRNFHAVRSGIVTWSQCESRTLLHQIDWVGSRSWRPRISIKTLASFLTLQSRIMVAKFATFATLCAQIVRYCVEGSGAGRLLRLNEARSLTWPKFARILFATLRGCQVRIVLTGARSLVSSQREGSKGRPWLHSDPVLWLEVERDFVLARTQRATLFLCGLLVSRWSAERDGISIFEHIRVEGVLAWTWGNAVIFNSAASFVCPEADICYAWFWLRLWHWVDCVVGSRSETSSTRRFLIQCRTCFDSKCSACTFWAQPNSRVLTGPRRIQTLGQKTACGSLAWHCDTFFRNCTWGWILTGSRSFVFSWVGSLATFRYSAAKIQTNSNKIWWENLIQINTWCREREGGFKSLCRGKRMRLTWMWDLY